MTITDPATIRAITDPAERVAAVKAAIETLAEQRHELACITYETVASMQADGLSLAQIGGALGVSRSRAQQLAKPPAERPRHDPRTTRTSA